MYWVMQRSHNVVVIAVITAFLVVPVGYLSAYPEMIPQWAGSLLADYCLETGVCDFHVLKAGLGIVLFVLVSVFIGFLEAVNPSGILDDSLDLKVEKIQEDLEDLSSWYVDDHPDQNIVEKDKREKSPRDTLRNDLAGFSLVIGLLFAFVGGHTFELLYTPAAALIAFGGYITISQIFFSDRDMFWEKNRVIQNHYREEQSESDQA